MLGLGSQKLGNNMIEAVNSVISNAQALKSSSGQINPVDVSQASLEVGGGASALPSAPYISPYIVVDTNYDKAVLQIRDSDTGDVLRQFPSESTLRARRNAEVTAKPFFKFESSDNSGSDAVTSSSSEALVSSGDEASFAAPSTPSLNGQAVAAATALTVSSQVGQSGQSTVSVTA